MTFLVHNGLERNNVKRRYDVRESWHRCYAELLGLYLAGGLVGVHHGSGLGSRVDDHAQYTAGSHHRVGPQRVVYAQRILLSAHVGLNILRNQDVFLCRDRIKQGQNHIAHCTFYVSLGWHTSICHGARLISSAHINVSYPAKRSDEIMDVFLWLLGVNLCGDFEQLPIRAESLRGSDR